MTIYVIFFLSSVTLPLISGTASSEDFVADYWERIDLAIPARNGEHTMVIESDDTLHLSYIYRSSFQEQDLIHAVGQAIHRISKVLTVIKRSMKP